MILDQEQLQISDFVRNVLYPFTACATCAKLPSDITGYNLLVQDSMDEMHNAGYSESESGSSKDPTEPKTPDILKIL